MVPGVGSRASGIGIYKECLEGAGDETSGSFDFLEYESTTKYEMKPNGSINLIKEVIHILPTPTSPYHIHSTPIAGLHKRPGEYFDPCQEAASRSLKCLARNGGDRDMCTDYFQAYRDCKKQWIEQRKEAKRKAGWFSS
ncbi:hypothetical protein BELL_0074g00170 [Botrytis elliptica]|uniref:CHCH domain-containing protein n=1 Tax=Botrytis elliptica TaxID=278938 RepID=A0A4Z1JXR5_9HELO|nr:hypothetical protein BELL_0074g00170 [Botrytis elliptica]